jgi:hypothetical protein
MGYLHGRRVLVAITGNDLNPQSLKLNDHLLAQLS